MTIRPCENRVGYDGETWGVEACGSHAVRDCSFCHWPVCARHLDSGETRQKCMDCYQAEGAAVRDRMASKAGKMNATLQRARITPGGRKAVTLPPARSGKDRKSVV